MSLHRQDAAITWMEHDGPDNIMLPRIQEAEVPWGRVRLQDGGTAHSNLLLDAANSWQAGEELCH